MMYAVDTTRVIDTLALASPTMNESEFLVVIGVGILIAAAVAITGFAFLVSWVSRGCP